MLPKPHFTYVILPVLTAITLAQRLSTPAWANDCTPITTGMLTAARTPHTVTISRTKDGKPVTNRMIQTKDAKYVEVNGKWRTLPFSADDVREMEKTLNESTLTCTRVGNDSLGGTTVTVYTAHIKNEDTEGDAKVWLGADGLPLKVENTNEGGHSSSTFDYVNADPPAESTPIGRSAPGP